MVGDEDADKGVVGLRDDVSRLEIKTRCCRVALADVKNGDEWRDQV
jgi:hypothetical protein